MISRNMKFHLYSTFCPRKRVDMYAQREWDSTATITNMSQGLQRAAELCSDQEIPSSTGSFLHFPKLSCSYRAVLLLLMLRTCYFLQTCFRKDSVSLLPKEPARQLFETQSPGEGNQHLHFGLKGTGQGFHLPALERYPNWEVFDYSRI